MARRAGVFTAAGHVSCGVCGHPRHRHVDTPPKVCSQPVITYHDTGVGSTVTATGRCDCTGYQPPKGS